MEVFVVVEGGGVLSGITLFRKYRRFCLFCLLSADTIVQIHPESNAAVVMITHITSPALGDSGVFMVPWLRALEQAHVMARSIPIRGEVPIYLSSILKNSSLVDLTVHVYENTKTMREAQNTINMKHTFYRLVCSKEKDKIELFY